MLLSTLTLQNFRSYTKQTFDLSPYITLIIGPNTSGKTNLLEAIYAVATGKSFRAELDRDMIHWDSEFTRLKGVTDDTILELVLTNSRTYGMTSHAKKYFVNGVSRRMVDFVGNLRAVLFSPEELEIVTGSPNRRRKYLDSVLVQADREYRRNMLSYERGVRQRNRLLDLISVGKALRNQLLFWNQLLIKSGSYLTDKRIEFVDFINAYKSEIDQYKLHYDKSVISESRLEQYRDEEVAAKATLVGPHRDDVIFRIKNEDIHVELSKFGSRGEQRLAILWLKLAELAYLREQVGDRPILLLDDIFSELDIRHRELVLNLVGQQQTIITSADTQMIELLRKDKRHQQLAVIQLTARV